MKSSLLAVLAAFNLGIGPAARAADTIRTYTADITAADSASHTITVVHEPSGYSLAAQVTGTTTILRTRYFVPGDISEGQTIRVLGADIDPQNHIVDARECSVESVPDGEQTVDLAHHRIAGKLFHEPGDAYRYQLGRPIGDWATTDGQTALGLRTADGQEWRLRWTLVTPLAHDVEPGTAQDLRAGRRAGVTLVDHGDGRADLKSIQVEDWFPGAESRDAAGRCPKSGPSGLSAEQVRAQLAAVQQRAAGMKDDLARAMPVSLEVKPALVLVGEPVELTLRVLSSKKPNAQAVLYPDYFHNHLGEKQNLDLAWKQDGTEAGLPVYTASAPLPAGKVGQYLVQWTCDAGGDIAQYSRTYAVCDNHTAVVLFLICEGEDSASAKLFHANYAPFDYWANLPLAMLTRLAAHDWANQSRPARQYGDVPDFGVTPGICSEPDDVQRAEVDAIHDAAPLVGYPRHPIAAWSYTMGNAAYREMQAVGDMTATTLCTENHIDGGMEIDAWGKPERPFFMSPEDFRKAGPGGPGHLVAFSQLQRHTQLAQHYLCDYCPEAASQGGGLFGSLGRDHLFDELAFSRMLDGYNAVFKMADCQKSPYFVGNDIQMSGARPGATEGNRMMFSYALGKAQTGDVVFADSAAVSQFYQTHDTATPESTSYFNDWWAGTHANDKPNNFPDTMTMENGDLYALALDGQILPESTYDYTTSWNYPDFGNDALPRRLHDPNSYLLPGKYDKFAATPKLTDTRPFQASRTDRDEAGALLVTVTVEAQQAHKNLPLALWNLPREFQPGDGWYEASENCRFVPIVAPYSGNLNGFLVADVAAGHNTFTLRLTSPARAPRLLDFKIGATLCGKVIERDGQSIAYIWPAGPWAATLHLHLPAGQSAQAYVAPNGEAQSETTGDNAIPIPQDQWMRLVGLSRDEILQSTAAE